MHRLLRRLVLDCDALLLAHRCPPVVALQRCHASKSKNSNLKKRSRDNLQQADQLIEKNEVKVTKEELDIWHDMTLSSDPRILASVNKKLLQLYGEAKPMDIQIMSKIVTGLGYKVKQVQPPRTVEREDELEEEMLQLITDLPTREPDMRRRVPIVTIMGHVDHGKTTLLDSLRKSNVVAGEFGGITQHIGAFTIALPNDDARITFLDTPGHAAFSAMRARGANATDFVVLVVAADDGVMEQTTESIRMAERAGVPLLIAVNKCDKPDIDVEAALVSLSTVGIVAESLGGNTQAVQVSALRGDGLVQLQEAIVTQAEQADLTADWNAWVTATVVESTTGKNGRAATVLVNGGTLKVGAHLVADTHSCKVRLLLDDAGNKLDSVEPGYAAVVYGWKTQPSAGDIIQELPSDKVVNKVVSLRDQIQRCIADKEAASIISQRRDQDRKVYAELSRFRLTSRKSRYKRRLIPFNLEEEWRANKQLNIVIKTDVDGSLDAILEQLSRYHCEKCALEIAHFGVGPVTQSDLDKAAALNAKIYVFNVPVPTETLETAESLGVSISEQNVIYHLLDDLYLTLNALLPPTSQENVLGVAEVVRPYTVGQGKEKWIVAGCRVTSGLLRTEAHFKLMRDDVLLWSGETAQIKHYKDEVTEIGSGQECGVRLELAEDIEYEMGDKIVCFVNTPVADTVTWDITF